MQRPRRERRARLIHLAQKRRPRPGLLRLRTRRRRVRVRIRSAMIHQPLQLRRRRHPRRRLRGIPIRLARQRGAAPIRLALRCRLLMPAGPRLFLPLRLHRRPVVPQRRREVRL